MNPMLISMSGIYPNMQGADPEEAELVRNSLMAPDGAQAALAGLKTLLAAQDRNVQITFRTYASRVHLRAGNPDPATGLVRNPSFNFFAAAQGQAGQSAGFDRTLGPDDVSVTTSSFLAANRAFIGQAMGLRVNYNMPLNTADVLVNRSTIRQRRGNVTYEFGRMLDWPAGLQGVQSIAASTTFPLSQVVFAGNGARSMMGLPADGRVYFAPKQEITLTMECRGSFYATTDGLPLNGDTNALIPNGGQEGESQGYIEWIIYGYEIVQPG
jgi:hypothetical protein